MWEGWLLWFGLPGSLPFSRPRPYLAAAPRSIVVGSLDLRRTVFRPLHGRICEGEFTLGCFRGGRAACCV